MASLYASTLIEFFISGTVQLFEFHIYSTRWTFCDLAFACLLTGLNFTSVCAPQVLLLPSGLGCWVESEVMSEHIQLDSMA